MLFQSGKSKRSAAGIVSAAMLLGCGSAMSTAMTASAADHNYGEALALSLYFFDSNACGTGITDGPLTWRGDCHTYDGEASFSEAENLPASAKAILDPDGDGRFDMAGGYHDAGDHVKFNLTIGYSMSSLAMSDYLNDGIYKKAGCFEHLAAVLKRGAEYLMKTTVLNDSGSVEAICYQVSDLADHSYWTSPETQDYQRKTYWMGAGNNNTKICGDMINGIAGAAYVLKDYDPAFSAECVKYAKAIYDFGKQHKGNEQTGNGGMYGNDADYQDEFLIAQAWLYLCGVDGIKPETVPNSKQYVSEFGSAYDGYLYSWDKQYQGYSAMMYKMTGNEAYKQELIAEYNDQGGLQVGKYNDRWGWGNSRYNCAVQMTALAIANGDAASDYAQGAKYQMDFLLGDNNLGYSFLLGYGDKWPTHIHHRAANPGDGETSVGNPSAKYTNYGMLVGGIDSAGYEDHADRYQYTEGALDYNACFALACAGLYSLYGGDASAVKDIESSASEINGSYSFGSGEVTPPTSEPMTTDSPDTEVTWGDADVSGTVDVSDAVLISRFALADPDAMVSEQGLRNADVDHNDTVNTDDVIMIVKFLAGIVKELK